MKNKLFRNYYLLSLVGVLMVSFYPIYMGISVLTDMINYGTVYAEDYPKYIIPYTPIALSVIIGVALIPVAMRCFKKYALLFGNTLSTLLFFVFEFLLEKTVVVTKTFTETLYFRDVRLESWQMYMCYVPPEKFDRTWTEVDVLMGEYSPAFKLHFYIISVVLILSILNCFYGFAGMIERRDTSRRKSLILQSAASAAFLGMCIWACFTAFYRDGSIQVSPLSAILMCLFFILFGVTVGIYVMSFTLNQKPLLSVWLPGISAALVTLIMYVGEMILLSGHLYRFGKGFLFDSIPGIVLSPVDIAVILASGGVAAIIADAVRNKKA